MCAPAAAIRIEVLAGDESHADAGLSGRASNRRSRFAIFWGKPPGARAQLLSSRLHPTPHTTAHPTRGTPTGPGTPTPRATPVDLSTPSQQQSDLTASQHQLHPAETPPREKLRLAP